MLLPCPGTFPPPVGCRGLSGGLPPPHLEGAEPATRLLPSVRSHSKLANHANRPFGVDFESTGEQALELLAAFSITGQRRMGLSICQPPMEGSFPALPDRPVFQGKCQRFPVNGHQHERVAVVTSPRVPLRLVEVRRASEVGDASSRSVTKAGDRVHSLPHHLSESVNKSRRRPEAARGQAWRAARTTLYPEDTARRRREARRSRSRPKPVGIYSQTLSPTTCAQARAALLSCHVSVETEGTPLALLDFGWIRRCGWRLDADPGRAAGAAGIQRSRRHAGRWRGSFAP